VPRVEASVIVELPVELAFAVSQTQGEVRYRWDPFVKRQVLLDADRPAKGVRTLTKSRHGLEMVSEYLSYRPPTQVGMRMVEGPRFFRTFSGGWSFATLDASRTEATWRYSFACRPKLLAYVAEPLGRWYLARDIRRRIAGYAEGCADPVVVEAARADLEGDRRRGGAAEG
jgi:hypothetical protein